MFSFTLNQDKVLNLLSLNASFVELRTMVMPNFLLQPWVIYYVHDYSMGN